MNCQTSNFTDKSHVWSSDCWGTAIKCPLKLLLLTLRSDLSTESLPGRPNGHMCAVIIINSTIVMIFTSKPETKRRHFAVMMTLSITPCAHCDRTFLQRASCVERALRGFTLMLCKVGKSTQRDNISWTSKCRFVSSLWRNASPYNIHVQVPILVMTLSVTVKAPHLGTDGNCYTAHVA